MEGKEPRPLKNGSESEDRTLIAWIRNEIVSTRVAIRQEVVGYEETLEPNPEMFYCEFTSYPTTRDRQHIIVRKNIIEDVPRTVLDETRASAAAEALVSLILADERRLSLAEELMGHHPLFTKQWERLAEQGKSAKTKRTALRYLGRTPFLLFLKKLHGTAAVLRPPIVGIGKLIAAAGFYGTMIYLIRPNSKIGLWIGGVANKIFTALKRTILG